MNCIQTSFPASSIRSPLSLGPLTLDLRPEALPTQLEHYRHVFDDADPGLVGMMSHSSVNTSPSVMSPSLLCRKAKAVESVASRLARLGLCGRYTPRRQDIQDRSKLKTNSFVAIFIHLYFVQIFTKVNLTESFIHPKSP
ncbi:unnamed protein product [Protopolystoma xenopodis]|uniref:Uncharacterized protein n=1 Tax=Protopolystoma xenopodis TaxID=117903 RepID=A0A3S5ATP1_9PLAT|nr:unnamed protein product [Protopolystoma xenopodis]